VAIKPPFITQEIEFICRNIKKERIMKKLIISSFIILVPLIALSQSFIGFKAGGNFSNFSITSEAKNNWSSRMTPGYQVGAFYGLEFGGMFGVQLEASYTRRGSAFRSKVNFRYPISLDQSNPNNQIITLVTGETTYKDHISYLDFPLLFRYNMRGRSIRPYLAAGPQLGFALSAMQKDQLVDGIISTHQYLPFEDTYIPTPISSRPDFHTFDNRRMEIGEGRNDEIISADFGILLGAGLEIELNFGSILLEARYYMGMTDIDNSANPAATIKNRSLMINIGYVFPLGMY